MPAKPVVTYPSPWLLAKASPIDVHRDPWRDWAADLKDTLDANPGVGIAAPQIGLMRRMVVINPTRFRNPPEKTEILVWLNPRITQASGRTTAREGCLSVPGFLGETLRRRRVEIVHDLLDGTPSAPLVAKGFMAIVAQHEIDHLNGILFLDRLVDRRAALRLRVPAA